MPAYKLLRQSNIPAAKSESDHCVRASPRVEVRRPFSAPQTSPVPEKSWLHGSTFRGRARRLPPDFVSETQNNHRSHPACAPPSAVECGGGRLFFDTD